MNFLKRRQLKEEVKVACKEALHARNMREDICSPELLENLATATERLRTLWREKADEAALRSALDELVHVSHQVYPPHPRPKWHENTEVLVVALGVAMAIRAYFFQPFKIPTGSMQPTLNGIIEEAHQPDWTDKVPFSLAKWLVFGSDYKPNQGELKTAGDHVIVNKFIYNFVPPKRGNVIVFDTAGISVDERKSDVYAFIDANGREIAKLSVVEENGELVDAAEARPLKEIAQMLANRYRVGVNYVPVQSYGISLTYYIKRLVGEPGDEISIDNGYLVANGEKITEPFPFERQVKEYGGYEYAAKIHGPAESIQLADDEFLPFGDNSGNSRDGRYFGGVKCDKLLGPAVVVYWPISEHWGKIR
jgi:signal peptidase I